MHCMHCISCMYCLYVLCSTHTECFVCIKNLWIYCISWIAWCLLYCLYGVHCMYCMYFIYTTFFCREFVLTLLSSQVYLIISILASAFMTIRHNLSTLQARGDWGRFWVWGHARGQAFAVHVFWRQSGHHHLEVLVMCVCCFKISIHHGQTWYMRASMHTYIYT